jgi:hypothetical protein
MVDCQSIYAPLKSLIDDANAEPARIEKRKSKAEKELTKSEHYGFLRAHSEPPDLLTRAWRHLLWQFVVNAEPIDVSFVKDMDGWRAIQRLRNERSGNMHFTRPTR